MDPSSLAAQLVATLAPVIPSIVKGASGAAGKELWEKLKSLASRDARLEAALKDVEANPTDELDRAALQKAIRDLAASDDAVRRELEGALSRSGIVAGGDVFSDVDIIGSPNAQVGHRRTTFKSPSGDTDDNP